MAKFRERNQRSFSTTVGITPNLAPVLREAFAELRTRGLAWLHGDQGYDGPAALACSAEIRDRGQSFEIETAIDAASAEAGDVAAIAAAFHAEHERVYGHADRRAALQVIALRLVVSGRTVKPDLPRHDLVPGEAPPVRRATAFLDDAEREVAVYHRDDLKPGQTFAGPAIVTQDDCTTVVPTGLAASVDAYANLRISPEAAR